MDDPFDPDKTSYHFYTFEQGTQFPENQLIYLNNTFSYHSSATLLQSTSKQSGKPSAVSSSFCKGLLYCLTSLGGVHVFAGKLYRNRNNMALRILANKLLVTTIGAMGHF